MKKMFKQTAAALLSLALLGSAMPFEAGTFALPQIALTAKAAAASTAVLSGDTLTLSGNVVLEDVKAFQNNEAVKHVVCAPGTVLPWSCRSMFANYPSVESFDFSNADTSAVHDMGWMFYDCPSLTTLDLTGFNTSSAANMHFMMGDCANLATVTFGSQFDTSNVTDMGYMFCHDYALTSLDLSGFRTPNLVQIEGMFYECDNLKSITFGSQFDTSKVYNMSYVFKSCKSLTTLDLSSFDTNNVKEEGNPAGGYPGRAFGMFMDCTSLKTIYVCENWNMEHAVETERMFDGCTSLVGGEGTAFDSDHTNDTYARIDGGADAPGYLTDKNTKYDLYIAGTQVSDKNLDDILGNGAFSYDPAGNVLAVKKSYTAPNDSTLLENRISGLTINIQNDATLSSNAYNGFLIQNDTTIKGSGVLTLNAGKTGISVTDNASLYLDNLIADITAEYYGIKGDDPQGNYGAQTKEKLLVCNSDIYATGWAHGAITDFSSIKLTKCHADMPLYMDGFYFYDPNYDFDPAEEVVISAEWTSDLSVADTQVTYQNAGDILGDGNVSYDRRSKTLTISGDYRFSGNNYFISNGIDDLIIKVASDSTIDVANKFAFGSFHHNMTITGPGKLTMNGGINVCNAKLTIRDANLDVRFYVGIKGYPFHDSLAIINSMIHAEGVYGAVCDFENGITLQDCHITVPENAIYSGTDICNSDGSSAKVVDIVPGSAFSITKQPENASGCIGDQVQFAVEAAGDNLIYQWQYYNTSTKKWENTGLAGNKTPKLTVSVLANRNGMKYHCIVKDSTGTKLTSSAATLTVNPKITAQPVDASGSVGDKVQFTVEATGIGLIYQWQYYNSETKKWENTGLAGNKTPTLTVSVLANRNGMKYHCIVKDTNGTKLTSSATALKVNPKIVTQPVDASDCIGDKVQFTVEATGVGLIYQWQYYNTETKKWENTGLAGNKTATLTVTVTSARNGMKYHCIVKDSAGTKLTSTAATLKVLPKIVTQPQNVSATAGSTAKFTVEATGIGLVYQWQYYNTSTKKWENTGLAGNKTATLSVTAISSRNGMKYHCIVKDSAGNKLTSSAATLTVK